MGAVNHAKSLTIADDGDASRVQPSDWNDDLVVDWGSSADLQPTGPVAIAGSTGKVMDAGSVLLNPALPRFAAGRWYGGAGSYDSSIVAAACRLYARPFLVGGSTEFAGIGMFTGSPVSGQTVALAVYTDDGGKPGALLFTTGELNADASVVTGLFDATFAGTVWVAVVAWLDPITVLLSSDDGTGGTWTLTVLGHTTSAIAWNASAASVKTAVEALSSVGTGKVTSVTGTNLPSTGYTVTFDGSIAFQPTDLSLDISGITGGSPVVDVEYTIAALPFDATSQDPLIGLADPLTGGALAAGYSQDGIVPSALPDPWGSTLTPAIAPLIFLRVKP